MTSWNGFNCSVACPVKSNNFGTRKDILNYWTQRREHDIDDDADDAVA